MLTVRSVSVESDLGDLKGCKGLTSEGRVDIMKESDHLFVMRYPWEKVRYPLFGYLA
jgi:hypothetical protein